MHQNESYLPPRDVVGRMGVNPLATADVERRAKKAIENRIVDMGPLMEVTSKSSAKTYLTQKDAVWKEDKDAVQIGRGLLLACRNTSTWRRLDSNWTIHVETEEIEPVELELESEVGSEPDPSLPHFCWLLQLTCFRPLVVPMSYEDGSLSQDRGRCCGCNHEGASKG